MAAYHMNRQDRAIKDEAEMLAILRSGKYAVIALCRGDEPYVVTLNYGHDASRHALYFHCAAKGLKLDFVTANPNACATVIDDLGYVNGECSHKYRSVVIFGKMTVVNDPEEKRQALVIMIDQLEKDPEPVKARFLSKPERIAGVGILRLDIREMTGKKGAD